MSKFTDRLQQTFCTFGIEDTEVGIVGLGPTLGRFSVRVPEGTKLAKVKRLADDIALALGVPAVWVTNPIAPWTIGLDIPRENRETVTFNQVRCNVPSVGDVPLYLGLDVIGTPIVPDLAKLPHLLVAGRTGSGKSVCLHSVVHSVIACNSAKLVLIDPKRVEFEEYRKCGQLYEPVVTEAEHADKIVQGLVDRMEHGYQQLSSYGAKDLNEYQRLSGSKVGRVVVVVDELADLLLCGSVELEKNLIRIAQKGRAVGIHLVLATQRPTTDVISGLLKANVPARLSLQVVSKLESRVILDEHGAESLLGNGDFLFENGKGVVRGQGALVA